MIVLTLLFIFILSNSEYASNCETSTKSDENSTQVAVTKLSSESQELKDLLKSSDFESAAILISKITKQASELPKFVNNEDSSKIGENKAFLCSKLDCSLEEKLTPVCACNFITGNVASFKNKCDTQKHNCRFGTNFKVILDEICPWEFASRRSDREFEFNYDDPKYYN